MPRTERAFFNIKPTTKLYTFFGEWQIYQDGRVYNLTTKKYEESKTELLTFKDYDSVENYRSSMLGYKRRRIGRKQLIWLAFKGTVPSNRVVNFKNKRIRGHSKFALDNLCLRGRVKSYVKKTRLKEEVKARLKERTDIFKGLMHKGKTFNDIMEETKYPLEYMNRIKKKLSVRELSILNFNKERLYLASKLFQGYDLAIISTRSRIPLTEFYERLSTIVGIKDVKQFSRIYKVTMRVMHNNGMSEEDIKKMVIGDYKKWLKKHCQSTT